MNSTRLVALAACFIAACESPTRPVDVAEDSTPLAAKPAPGPSITVTALPSLGGAAQARGINDLPTIVGWSVDAAGVGNAVKWTLLSGTWTVAQLPAGNGAQADAINAGGDIVGVKGNRAVLWPATGGGPNVLGCGADLGPDRAAAINSGGTIAGGRSETVDPPLTRAVVWRPGQCREDLPALAEGMSAEARGIDAAGNVSGHAYDAAGDEWAVRWAFNGTSWSSPEKLKDGLHAAAWASNSGGDIAGSACLGTPPAGCQAHAVLWPAPGDLVRTDLGTLGGQVSAAFGVNGAKEAVGWSWTSRNRSTHGFIWSATTGMRDLRPLRANNYAEAHGVNNVQDGIRHVVGFSRSNSGQRQAVVWTVP
jgi:probable HAF family extracellular repeat protein